MGLRQSHLIHTPTTPFSPSLPKLPSLNPQITLNFHLEKKKDSTEMAALNSSVLACNYAISGSELSSKVSRLPSVAAVEKLGVIRAQQPRLAESSASGRRAALFGLGAALFATSSAANAGVIDDYLEKSKANKELNDKKRLATSGANFARAYTVQFGTCKFPENFTGCQDLAKQKKVPFISEDLALECEGKGKYECGSNVFWKW
ncbi:photosystem i reaction center subunit n chloroplastic [Phtheirospermum japonicum]|uniref:Photosystem I reaction center subunit N, chloroplastic n=1 Tax=Phtheirospermum japonicum TaxID=374723 RepID=A0A830C452_9LAMI|nr:photosystem i reaction center subunit n chloroplastic [Phtheirospermum japonicum]